MVTMGMMKEKPGQQHLHGYGWSILRESLYLPGFCVIKDHIGDSLPEYILLMLPTDLGCFCLQSWSVLIDLFSYLISQFLTMIIRRLLSLSQELLVLLGGVLLLAHIDCGELILNDQEFRWPFLKSIGSLKRVVIRIFTAWRCSDTTNQGYPSDGQLVSLCQCITGLGSFFVGLAMVCNCISHTHTQVHMHFLFHLDLHWGIWG